MLSDLSLVLRTGKTKRRPRETLRVAIEDIPDPNASIMWNVWEFLRRGGVDVGRSLKAFLKRVDGDVVVVQDDDDARVFIKVPRAVLEEAREGLQAAGLLTPLPEEHDQLDKTHRTKQLTKRALKISGGVVLGATALGILYMVVRRATRKPPPTTYTPLDTHVADTGGTSSTVASSPLQAHGFRGSDTDAPRSQQYDRRVAGIRVGRRNPNVYRSVPEALGTIDLKTSGRPPLSSANSLSLSGLDS